MHHRHAAALLGFVAAFATPAFAAGDARTSLGPGLKDLTHYKGPTLTGERLRRCVALDDESRALQGQVRQANQDLEVAESFFKRLGDDLDHDEITLDHIDHDAIGRYNERVIRHEALVTDYNARLPAHTALVEHHNAAIDAFNHVCAGRAYLVSEWRAASAALVPSR
ncbi:MAG: hypothetical protein ABIW82_04325 [Dokdonella sp.]